MWTSWHDLDVSTMKVKLLPKIPRLIFWLGIVKKIEAEKNTILKKKVYLILLLYKIAIKSSAICLFWPIQFAYDRRHEKRNENYVFVPGREEKKTLWLFKCHKFCHDNDDDGDSVMMDADCITW